MSVSALGMPLWNSVLGQPAKPQSRRLSLLPWAVLPEATVELRDLDEVTTDDEVTNTIHPALERSAQLWQMVATVALTSGL